RETFSRVLFGLVSMMGIVITATSACSSASNSNAPNPNGKDQGASCTDASECKSLSCAEGKCTNIVSDKSPTDSQKDGDETDVYGGGPSAPKCADGKACKIGTDCASGSCSGTCVPPSPTDNVMNGDETDVDCGGSKAPKCAVDKGCATNADCASDACSY